MTGFVGTHPRTKTKPFTQVSTCLNCNCVLAIGVHDCSFNLFKYKWLISFLEAIFKPCSSQFCPRNLDVFGRFLLIQLFHLAGNQLGVLQSQPKRSSDRHHIAWHPPKACFIQRNIVLCMYVYKTYIYNILYNIHIYNYIYIY